MKKESRKLWSSVTGTFKGRIITGMLVIVPIGITVLIIGFLCKLAVDLLAPLARPLFGDLPAAAVAVMSLVLFVLVLYLVGFVAALFVGRKLIAIGEGLIVRIPLVKTIYSAAKQVVETLSLPKSEAFKGVVLLEFPRPGIQSLGFVTGRIRNAEGRECHKVFIPTSPNPTTGFLEIVPCDQAREAGLTVEEAIKMIVSVGILSPDSLGIGPKDEQTGG